MFLSHNQRKSGAEHRIRYVKRQEELYKKSGPIEEWNIRDFIVFMGLIIFPTAIKMRKFYIIIIIII